MDNRNEVREFLASRRAKVTLIRQECLPSPGSDGCLARAGLRWPSERRVADNDGTTWLGRVTDEEYPAANQA